MPPKSRSRQPPADPAPQDPHDPRGARRTHDGRVLVLHSQLLRYMTDAYYACHRDDAACCDALAELLGEVEEYLPDPQARIPVQAVAADNPGGAAAAEAVQAFARRWALPAGDGARDVRLALHSARRNAAAGRPAQPRLGFQVRAEVPGFPADSGALVGPDGRARVLPPYGVAVDADRRFLPRGEAMAHIEAELDRLRRDMVRQLDEQERVLLKHGWVYVPLAYDHPATLRRLAQRLYLRAVRRLSYGDIAQDECDRTGVALFEQSVAETVKHWAAELGVPLPPDKIRSRRARR